MIHSKLWLVLKKPSRNKGNKNSRVTIYLDFIRTNDTIPVVKDLRSICYWEQTPFFGEKEYNRSAMKSFKS